METFIGQASRWWDTHQSRLQTWTTTSNFFVEKFGRKKLTNQAQIPIFTQGQDPENQIKICEKQWRRLGYKDERTWPHLFPSTLTDLPNKWYKMEEARGETFLWYELREIFIKDVNFIPQDENFVETSKQIKEFIQLIENKPLKDN